MGGCGSGGRGALIVCINMRELCNSSGESNTTSQCIKKRSDGIDTVYVGQGSNPPSPPSEQHCPGSLFTLLCSLLFFFASFFAPAARAERLREIQNIPRLASHLSIISSRQQALFATGKKRGRRLTFSATREHRNLHGLSNNGNIVLLCAKVFTAFHFLSHGKLCER